MCYFLIYSLDLCNFLPRIFMFMLWTTRWCICSQLLNGHNCHFHALFLFIKYLHRFTKNTYEAQKRQMCSYHTLLIHTEQDNWCGCRLIGLYYQYLVMMKEAMSPIIDWLTDVQTAYKKKLVCRTRLSRLCQNMCQHLSLHEPTVTC